MDLYSNSFNNISHKYAFMRDVRYAGTHTTTGFWWFDANGNEKI